MQGIRVSKSGYSVKDPVQKMILTSEFPLLKLKASGTGTLNYLANTGEKTVTIAHNLGYVPQVFVYGHYLNENDGSVIARYKLWNFSDTAGLHMWEVYRFWADTTNLYVYFGAGYWYNTNHDFPYMYHIFYDPAT